MKKIALGISLALAAMAPAFADDAVVDPMTVYYGNTVMVVNAQGIESHTYYHADHTFDGLVPAFNYHYKGTWEVTSDGRLCNTFDPPVPGVTNPACNPLGPVTVGSSWTSADGGTGKLVAGVN